ncbi:dTDP-L-rhamnose 4-epimerase [Pseudomonas reidholzensis]|uniref:dTDP-L-rhamnose 4-epimerase n=1 Tax=Pseudomonas reidholzensis TaxID=1785162 RepID=A0A383RQT0_9PSED|nr:NAD-dependent epimerase/dehydratase family protein [Pseudomonas reidholzensis]SYX89429.1 dTDP-L-rhamnose 4-epimerase [Pseudomonas reidholzensis]
MTKTVLVTGGAGFIGSHLIPKLLADGFQVRVLDSLSPQIHGAVARNLEWLEDDGIEFIRGDVTRRTDWERALLDVDAIVHLAAETGTGQSMYEIARYNDVNSQGTALMFDVLGKMNTHRVTRVVLSSSRSIYGEGAYVHPVSGARVYPGARSAEQLRQEQWEPVCPQTGVALQLVATQESDLIQPASIYAATKYAQEDLVRIGCQSMGIGFAMLRLQNVYGERQSLNNPYTGILSIFSTKIRRDSELPLFEDGKESRDFVHVEDVTDALLAALTVAQAPDAAINVGSGVATSVRAVAEELTRAFGKSPNVVVTGQFRIGDIRHNYADISRLQSLLGVTPKVSLADGLQRFAAWVSSQPLPEDQLEKANQELRERKLMN